MLLLLYDHLLDLPCWCFRSVEWHGRVYDWSRNLNIDGRQRRCSEGLRQSTTNTF